MPLVQNDLVLRRFSPVDYGQPLTEAVICPYSGCPFSTGDGEAMKRHQQETRHPGWGRYEEKPNDKKWICPKEVCGASFLAWDHLYRHMMVHSRPLGCSVCPFRAAKSTCLKRHMKDSGMTRRQSPTKVSTGRERGKARYWRSNSFSPGFQNQAPTTRIRMFLKTAFRPPFQPSVHTTPAFLAIPTSHFEIHFEYSWEKSA